MNSFSIHSSAIFFYFNEIGSFSAVMCNVEKNISKSGFIAATLLSGHKPYFISICMYAKNTVHPSVFERIKNYSLKVLTVFTKLYSYFLDQFNEKRKH